MIIQALLSLVKGLLLLLLLPFHIPSLPSNVETVLASVASYLSAGLGIFATFAHLHYILVLFWAAVGIEAAFLVYKFILWIIRKIPAVSIE
jgi:hypothetical protein